MLLKMKDCQHNGKLITFCGLDGCGKTTLINMLKSYFDEMNISVFLTKQPTDEVRNSKIFRTYMDQPNHEGYEYIALSLSAAADRVQHSNQVILPALMEGNVVISDRYFYSCLANLQARGYENDLWIYDIAARIPKPDIAFFLDIDVETAVKRVRQRPKEKNIYVDMDLQYKLRNNYLQIAKENNGIVLSTINAPEVTFGIIKNELKTIFKK